MPLCIYIWLTIAVERFNDNLPVQRFTLLESVSQVRMGYPEPPEHGPGNLALGYELGSFGWTDIGVKQDSRVLDEGAIRSKDVMLCCAQFAYVVMKWRLSQGSNRLEPGDLRLTVKRAVHLRCVAREADVGQA